MAMDRGLTMTIANPSSQAVMNIKMASEVLLNKDPHSTRYIKYFKQISAEQAEPQRGNSPC